MDYITSFFSSSKSNYEENGDKIKFNYINCIGTSVELIINKEDIVEKNNLLIREIYCRNNCYEGNYSNSKTISLYFYNAICCDISLKNDEVDDFLNKIKIGSVVSFKCLKEEYSKWHTRIIGKVNIVDSLITEYNGQSLIKSLPSETIIKIYQHQTNIRSHKNKISECRSNIVKYTNLINNDETELILSSVLSGILINENNINNESNEIEDYKKKLEESQNDLIKLTEELNILINDFKVLIESIKDDWTYF